MQHEYIIGIMTCTCRLKEEAQRQRQMYYEPYMDKFPHIAYVQFVGVPTLDEPWKYDDETGIMQLRCPDDYVNLPLKVQMFYRACLELFPSVKGVFKTDDNISINIPAIADCFDTIGHIDYWGILTSSSRAVSSHLSTRSDVVSKYPILATSPVRVPLIMYCACTYYLSARSMSLVSYDQHVFKPFPDLPELQTIYYTENMLENLYPFEDMAVGVVLARHNIFPANTHTCNNIYDCAHYSGWMAGRFYDERNKPSWVKY